MSFIKNKELHSPFAVIKFKVNKIINNLLLTGEKFMPESYLKQPGLKYIACGPFTKHREGTEKHRETSTLRHL